MSGIIYEVIIIGAGPAGLFCASELAGKRNFLILEQGKPLEERLKSISAKSLSSKSDVLFGEGGAGLFSDGKLNFSEKIGGDILSVLTASHLKKIKDEFLREYRIKPVFPLSKYKKVLGGRCLLFPQYHFGTDYLPLFIKEVIKGFRDRILCNVEVLGLKKSQKGHFIIATKKKVYRSKNIVVATGQSNFDFTSRILNSFGIETISNKISVGFRLEAKAKDLRRYFVFQYDPKFIFETKKGEVRTFCSNPNGYVISEEKKGFVSANGHANKDKKSGFSNFALLIKVSPKSELLSVCKRITKETGGRLVVQNLRDFLQDSSTTNVIFEPSHKNYVLGKDMSFYFSRSIVEGLQEALKSLMKIEPKIINSIIYFPEIKIFPSKIKVKKNSFKSLVSGLYFIGDCTGYIHGLLNAILSGISCGKILAKK